MTDILPLTELSEGEECTITRILSDPEIRRRLLDMGLITGTRIRCAFKSPYGDPVAYLVRGALVALRKEDASKIFVSRRTGGDSYDHFPF